ncbi:hypothetical protein ACNQTT_10870, partial [Corynebacterium diphtheriae]
MSGNHQYESVITKLQHHHTHTQAPTMGLRSHEYEDTTKPDTRQGLFLVLVWLLVCSRVWNPPVRIRDHENPTTTTQ